MFRTTQIIYYTIVLQNENEPITYSNSSILENKSYTHTLKMII